MQWNHWIVEWNEVMMSENVAMEIQIQRILFATQMSKKKAKKENHRAYINGTTEFVDAKSIEDSSTYTEYNGQYEDALKMLEMEKKKLADIKNLAKTWNRGDWWNDSIDNMSIDQLEQFMISLYELRNKLLGRTDELLMNNLMFQ
ncbi:hypothetical protein P8452_00931 [Trifolium repens]|nr:hypothetical protein P8452_00931 [Trifolium repens]